VRVTQHENYGFVLVSNRHCRDALTCTWVKTPGARYWRDHTEGQGTPTPEPCWRYTALKHKYPLESRQNVPLQFEFLPLPTSRLLRGRWNVQQCVCVAASSFTNTNRTTLTALSSDSATCCVQWTPTQRSTPAHTTSHQLKHGYTPLPLHQQNKCVSYLQDATGNRTRGNSFSFVFLTFRKASF
jgi:hypothetical protein